MSVLTFPRHDETDELPAAPEAVSTEVGTEAPSRTVAIVCDGAHGVGKATVRILAAEGVDVVIGSSDEQALISLSDDITLSGGSVRYCVVRPGVASDYEQLVATAIHEFGRLDYVVNSVTVHPLDVSLHEMNDRALFHIAEDRIVPIVYGLRAALAYFMNEGSGTSASIVNVTTSVQPADTAHMAAAALTKNTAGEYGAYGIRINAIRAENIDLKLGSPLQPPAQPAPSSALARVGHPEDVAEVAAFVLSDSAAFVHGAVIAVDGGGRLPNMGVGI